MRTCWGFLLMQEEKSRWGNVAHEEFPKVDIYLTECFLLNIRYGDFSLILGLGMSPFSHSLLHSLTRYRIIFPGPLHHSCYFSLCCLLSSHLICEPPENSLPSEMNLIHPRPSPNNGLQYFLPPRNTWNETIQIYLKEKSCHLLVLKRLLCHIILWLLFRTVDFPASNSLLASDL